MTRVGLGTFVDPRHGGGKLNARTTEDLVRLMPIDGEDYLFYKAFPIDVALIRAHHRRHRGQPDDGARGADAGVAGHRDGGAQQRWHRHRAGRARGRARLAASAPSRSRACWWTASWWPRPEDHQQTFAEPYSPAFAGELRVPLEPPLLPMALNDRKFIARRAALELPPNAVVNLGIGMPEGVAAWRPKNASSSSSP